MHTHCPSRLCAVRLLREELQLLQEPGSYVGEVVKVCRELVQQDPLMPALCVSMISLGWVGAVCAARQGCAHSGGFTVCVLTWLGCFQVMGKNKVLVKAHPEGKYVVDIDKDIDVAKLTTGARVALKNDSYTLHLCLPTKVDPLVSLMKVENVPDSTYDMIGGADEQIKEIKEVRTQTRSQAR